VSALDPSSLTHADQWILARLDVAIEECDRALGPLWPTLPHDSPDARAWRENERYAGLRLNEYAESARRFVWNELADWYLESVKARLDVPGADREVARAVLVHAFDNALRLLHPAVPFVTEALWQKLPGHRDGTFLARAEWPARRGDGTSEAAQDFELVREAILAVRQSRADNGVAPGKPIDVLIRPATDHNRLRGVFESEGATIGRLTRANVRVVDAAPAGAAAHAVISGGTEIIIPLAGLIDIDKECARLRGEVAELEKQIMSREGRLNNPKYVERAPEQVVANDRAILNEMKTKREQLVDKVRSLCGV
jgi:valyl-tRNA synthetase